MTHVTHDTHIEHSHTEQTLVFGFWVYLMSDCFLFASLFATYAVLHGSTFGGPASATLFSLPLVLLETLILLTSSFTAGLALYFGYRRNVNAVLASIVATFALGAWFLGLELHEFSTLVTDGHSWTSSAFLSSFFTLVGTHGAHIAAGLIWMLVLCAQVLRSSINHVTLRRLLCFSIFWHFLDIVWICIFSFVYLLGAL